MTDANTQDYTAWIGHAVKDRDGEKVGKVSQIFMDDHTGQPEWVAVNTGRFKSHSSFVPIEGAEADGDDLIVAHNKAKVADAPRVDDNGDGHLEAEEEEELYRYYGRNYDADGRADDRTDHAGEAGVVGRDTSGPTTDKAMTRSEEQLNVGTQRRESGKARLRKYVVTEQVSKTVPVSHEEIRVEREPITDANRGDAMSGSDISEEEHEITLHEERPVVEKQVVAQERVKLSSETVTGEETVTDEVRQERIEAEGADAKHRR